MRRGFQGGECHGSDPERPEWRRGPFRISTSWLSDVRTRIRRSTSKVVCREPARAPSLHPSSRIAWTGRCPPGRSWPTDATGISRDGAGCWEGRVVATDRPRPGGLVSHEDIRAIRPWFGGSISDRAASAGVPPRPRFEGPPDHVGSCARSELHLLIRTHADRHSPRRR